MGNICSLAEIIPMLYDRIYKPKRNELIYHYCSAETFNAICTNKTIRLCDIFSIIDFSEMHWDIQCGKKWQMT